jgi:hypothetical protein
MGGEKVGMVSGLLKKALGKFTKRRQRKNQEFRGACANRAIADSKCTRQALH